MKRTSSEIVLKGKMFSLLAMFSTERDDETEYRRVLI